MRTRIILWIWIAVLVPMAGSARANPQCDPYGVCTLRGDVQALLAGKGVIEISPPDEFVYAVIDGAAAVQQFEVVKAGLRNRIADRAMGPGTVMAIARYRLRTDYQNNLSTDPPSKEDVEKNITLSFSEPIDVASIPSDTPLQLVFDFSADPIDAGITDLFILVVFLGQMEGVEDQVWAIGWKDMNEPHHITTWNNTDWFLVDYQLRTGQQIRNDSELENFIIDNCWTIERFIDPLATQEYLGFTAGEQDSPVFVAHYQALAPGRFGRVIFIADADLFFLHRRSVTVSPDSDLTWKWEIPGVTNAINAAGLHTTAPENYRGIHGHINSAWIWTCPFTGYSAEIFDETSSKAPADTVPVPVTTITFP